MPFKHLVLVAVVAAACWTGGAAAGELAATANPEQLGFSPERLKRITETYQGYVDGANCRARSW